MESSFKTIAFDVDGTLIHKSSYGDDTPRYSVLQLMFQFKQYGWKVYVWSGSGREYAKRWCEKLGIAEMVQEVVIKGSFVPEIAVDDMVTKLGKVNIQV